MSQRLVAVIKLFSLLTIILAILLAYFTTTASPPLHPVVAGSLYLVFGLLALVGLFILISKIEE